ncbi:pyruvate formate lyase family protein [Candidatus Poribacteria bacterium]
MEIQTKAGKLELNERLETFREEAYARGFGKTSSPKEANWTKAFFELYSQMPLALRQAHSFAYTLLDEPIYIHDHSLIAGQVYQACPGAGCPELSSGEPRWQEYSVSSNARKEVIESLPENEWYGKFFNDGASPGHVGWDWGMLLDMGTQGLLERYARAEKEAQEPKAREFYACVQIVLAAFLEWSELHVQKLEETANIENDPVRKSELVEMASVCRRVPRFPASSFQEAVQAFWFQHLAVMFENPFGGNGPGRLDFYLWPYLERDLEAGHITMDEASELVLELFVKLHERIAPADGWVEAIVAGGRAPDGSPAINPLSHLIVEAAIALRQTHPSVYVRLPEDAPDDFVDLSVRYLLEGENRGQIYGDDAIIRALHGDGIAMEDARNWCAGGCMEVGIQGGSGDLLFAFAHNTSRTLELILNGGELLQTGEKVIPHDRTLADYEIFDELWTDFEREFKKELGILMRRLDIYLESYARYRPSFLLSSMVHDCLDRGRSINDGGARYPHYGGSAVGIPNVGDSLYAIKRAAFDEKRVSGEEVYQALCANFQGYENLRKYLLNIPKYGSEDPGADAMTERVLQTYCETIKSHRNPQGGHCRPIILGFVWVVSFGQQVGATPDGRLAGQVLAHSLSPQSGSAVKGLTAAINSATSFSFDEVSGGASMMWDLDVNWVTPEVLRPVLLTFFQRGGHIFQGNLMDIAVLKNAQENPERYRDLMVRVGGYSARFITLSNATQAEIINRYKYKES